MAPVASATTPWGEDGSGAAGRRWSGASEARVGKSRRRARSKRRIMRTFRQRNRDSTMTNQLRSNGLPTRWHAAASSLVCCRLWVRSQTYDLNSARKSQIRPILGAGLERLRPFARRVDAGRRAEFHQGVGPRSRSAQPMDHAPALRAVWTSTWLSPIMTVSSGLRRPRP